MRGRVAVLLLSFLIAAPSFPQCTFNKLASAEFRATYLDVFADGNDLWTATSYGLSLFDRSVDPPRVIASIAVPGTTRDVRASNGIAYAASGSSIAVVRRNGKALDLVRTIDTGSTVNDLLLAGNFLYAATANGIVQYDLLDRTNPSKTAVSFATSSSNVSSLALRGSTLYAADGDTSIENFDLTIPQSPQKGTSVTSVARATSLHFINNRLYASDSLQSEVFLATGAQLVSLATVAFPTASAAQIAGDAFFLGSNDRRLRAFDFATAGNPIELFRDDITPSSGNVNKVTALASAGGRLYVAAGDAGLLTYDISSFTSPFALRSYAATPSTSIVSTGDHLYITPSSGGVIEYAQSNTGALTQARTWDSANADVVRDGGSGFLLTTSGAKATLWSLGSTIPSAISTTTFATSVKSAVLIGTKVVAVLSTGTLALADMSQLTPTPQDVTFSGATALNAIARSGSALVVSQINDDGTTTLYSVASLNNIASPAKISVPGVVGALALNGSTAAAFSFPGIQLVNLTTGAITTIPLSNAVAARSLAYTGTTIVELTTSGVTLWDTTTKTLTRQFTLPSDAIAVDVADESTTLADVLTSTGVTSVSLNSSSKLPVAYAAPNGNAFYKKVAASADRIYLFDGRGVDFFSNALHYRGGIRAGGLVDMAASARGFYTLSASAIVTYYSPDGVQLAQVTAATGGDVESLGINTAGDAVWVTIRQGCISGGCEEKTLVLNPATLAQTSVLNGGAVDVATSGSTAAAIFDLPAEVRTINVADPLHPVVTASRAAEGTKTPASIAIVNNTIYVLGDKLYAYSSGALANIGTQLDAFTNASGNVYTDQRVRNVNTCAVISARTFNPQLYSTTNPAAWTVSGAFESPSLVRSIAAVSGTMYVLTDHSLEVWSTGTLPKAPKREPVGH